MYFSTKATRQSGERTGEALHERSFGIVYYFWHFDHCRLLENII